VRRFTWCCEVVRLIRRRQAAATSTFGLGEGQRTDGCSGRARGGEDGARDAPPAVRAGRDQALGPPCGRPRPARHRAGWPWSEGSPSRCTSGSRSLRPERELRVGGPRCRRIAECPRGDSRVRVTRAPGTGAGRCCDPVRGDCQLGRDGMLGPEPVGLAARASANAPGLMGLLLSAGQRRGGSEHGRDAPTTARAVSRDPIAVSGLVSPGFA
jgi:hypothetical protein